MHATESVDRTTPKCRPTELDYSTKDLWEMQQHPSPRCITHMKMYSPCHCTMPSSSPQGRPRGGGRRHGSSRRRLVHGRLVFFLRKKGGQVYSWGPLRLCRTGGLGREPSCLLHQTFPDKFLSWCNRNRNAMRRGSVTQHGEVPGPSLTQRLNVPCPLKGFHKRTDYRTSRNNM